MGWIVAVTGLLALLVEMSVPAPGGIVPAQPASASASADPGAGSRSAMPPAAGAPASAHPGLSASEGTASSLAQQASFHVIGRLEDQYGKPCCGGAVALDGPEGTSPGTDGLLVDLDGAFRLGPFTKVGGKAQLRAWLRNSKTVAEVPLLPRAGIVDVGTIRLDVVALQQGDADAASSVAMIHNPDLESPAAPAETAFQVRLRRQLPRTGSGSSAFAGIAQDGIDLVPVQGGYLLRLWLWWQGEAPPSEEKLQAWFQTLPEPVAAIVHRHRQHEPGRNLHDQVRAWIQARLARLPGHPTLLQISTRLSPAEARDLVRGWLARNVARWQALPDGL